MIPALPRIRSYAASPASGRLALAGACVLLGGWALLMAGLHPAQYADSIEQYNWSHSLEWGYWKHPPLTTWLMAGAVALLGASHWTAPLLAAACLAATAAFVWSFARTLLGERAAQLAIVLWPLHQALTMRADVFNHNRTVLLASAAIAWAALRASRSRRTRDWLVFGLCAGLGLLAKYQSGVTILGALAAFFLAGTLRDARTRRQLGAAALVAFIVVLPHFAWSLNHAMPTLLYVDQSAPVLQPVARVTALFGFVGVQVTLLVAMLAAAAAARYGPGAPPPAVDAHGDASAEVRPWMIGLVGLPVVVLVAVVLATGHKPQKMWGLHTLMFLPLWLAWHIERARPGGPVLRNAAAVGVTLMLGSAAWAVFDANRVGTRPHSADPLVPARELALAATADWHRATRCPLRLVKGDPFPAGLVSLYSGAHVPVLEDGDFEKSPWITADELREAGALDVHGPVERRFVPEGVSSLSVPAPAKFRGPAAIWWHVVLPGHECPA